MRAAHSFHISSAISNLFGFQLSNLRSCIQFTKIVTETRSDANRRQLLVPYDFISLNTLSVPLELLAGLLYVALLGWRRLGGLRTGQGGLFGWGLVCPARPLWIAGEIRQLIYEKIKQ